MKNFYGNALNADLKQFLFFEDDDDDDDDEKINSLNQIRTKMKTKTSSQDQQFEQVHFKNHE